MSAGQRLRDADSLVSDGAGTGAAQLLGSVEGRSHGGVTGCCCRGMLGPPVRTKAFIATGSLGPRRWPCPVFLSIRTSHTVLDKEWEDQDALAVSDRKTHVTHVP